jgi:hypothetical protein
MHDTDTHRPLTEAQINANRENAKKSTGPRTAEGKAASSRNGLKHGLCANQHILPGEDPEDFLLLLKDLYDRFHPVGLSEEKLVLRIAADQWRLDRIFPMEAGIYRERCHEVAMADHRHQELYDWEINRGNKKAIQPAPHDPGDLLARAFNADCAGPNALAKLARYETSLARSLERNLRQLKAFQAARAAQVPLETSPEDRQKPPKPAPDPPPTPSEAEDYEAKPNSGAETPSCPPPPTQSDGPSTSTPPPA